MLGWISQKVAAAALELTFEFSRGEAKSWTQPHVAIFKCTSYIAFFPRVGNSFALANKTR